MDENNYLTITDDDGNEVLYEILFTFDSDEYKKSYVLYMPVEQPEEDEEVEVLCSSYEPEGEESIGTLLPIEDDKEWAMVEEVFNTFISNMEDEEDDEDEDEDEE